MLVSYFMFDFRKSSNSDDVIKIGTFSGNVISYLLNG